MVTKKTDTESSSRLLARLAELYGVQTRYRDALGQFRGPSSESLFKTLLALDEGVNTRQGLEAAIRRREAELSGRMVDPVAVAWEGELPPLTLRVPGTHGAATVRLALTFEDGSSLRGDTILRAAAARLMPGQTKRALGLGPARLPWGRHRLVVEVEGQVGETWVISAPRRCWEGGEVVGAAAGSGAAAGRGTTQWPGAAAGVGGRSTATIGAALAALDGKPWGLFAPVYALRSTRDWGAGDLTDLAALTRWTREAGGSLVATLPLLASSFGPDADPSPYRPVSRLFWNEFFLAPEETVEWALCERTRSAWQTGEWQSRRDALRVGDYVDYEAVMGLKRPVIAELARCFFEGADAGRWQDFEEYLAANPHALRYAAFRAAAGGRSSRPETGGVARGAWSEEERYHLYCQWQMDRRLAAIPAGGAAGLLFDLPLGVHPEGFDALEWPGLFAEGMSTGAPPDPFFTAGQDWCTPPLHPEADRQQGYAYFSACLRNLMRPAAVIRIDHMMAFHRLFWMPEGTDPKDGTYVGYPAEEFYALLSCESHRCKTAVLGEDLGTVPSGVRASMQRHGVARTAVFLGALRPWAKTLEPKIPAGAVVSLETHDMAPLAGFLHGDDIETRVETGQLDRDAARREAAARRHLVSRLARQFATPGDDPDSAAPAVLAGCLASLARSAAEMVLVNLEDLLLERRPQNVPGTGAERPNWRRKMAATLEGLPRYKRASK